ncbi:MAG: hypothetical protein ABIN23_05745 [candidate division WOR-3 bacterium]
MRYSEIDPEFKKLQDIGAVELTDYAVEVRYGEEIYFRHLMRQKKQ